jgi:8-oxo-dGTP diphosphatase
MQQPRHIIVVGALVRNAGGALLLIRHRRRGWEIPQGRVEEGEGLLDALRREVHEETGIEIEPGPLAAIHSKLTPPAALILTFLATGIGGKPTPSEESPEVAWVEAAEALPLVTHPVNRQRLETLLAFRDRTLFVSYVTDPFRVLQQIGPSSSGL